MATRSKTRSIWLLVVIYALIVLLGVFVIRGFDAGIYEIRPLRGIQQGLDITGGVYTVYEAADPNVEDFEAKMEDAQLVLRERLDQRGFTEATITRQGTDRIRVEIPINDSSEITDPTEISQFIGTPAQLEFRDPDGNVIMEGADIERAYRSLYNNQPVVAFSLTPDGTTKFAEATQRLLNQTIGIYVDGQMISEPTVNSAILNGEGIIEGSFTEDTALDLALQIESGALPLDLNEIEVRTISATLGVGALENSILAGLVGMIVLFIYMIVIYRVPGIAACTGLAVYTLLVLLCLATVPGVQLTLPGIAGIVLGVGMAVDANVIIFARFHEEFSRGKSLRSAYEAGSKKAFVTILDSNVTTLICAVVLAIFGTGQIKSFAYTLIISIIVSMFAALVVTNGIMRLYISLGHKNPNMYMWHAKELRAAALAARENGGA